MVAIDARTFLENLTRDASLRAQLIATGAADVNTVADFAFAKGFVFTEQDLKSTLADFPDNTIIDQLRERLKVAKVVHNK